MPEAKREYYRNNIIDSIKQYLMMKQKTWDSAAISMHYEDMKSVLLNSIVPKINDENA